MLNLLGRELEISIGELEFRFGVGNQPAMGVQKGRQCLELHFLIFEYTFPPGLLLLSSLQPTSVLHLPRKGFHPFYISVGIQAHWEDPVNPGSTWGTTEPR